MRIAVNRTVKQITRTSRLGRIVLQSGLRKIIANTGWLFVDNLVNVATGLLVGAWVARYLGPAQYGIFNYALALVSLLIPIVVLGLKDIVIRDIVRSPEDKDEILGTAFGLKLAGSLLALGLVIGVGQITRPEDVLIRWLVAILAGRFVFEALSQTLDYWFQSQVQAKFTVWAKNIGLLLSALVKIGLILSEAPLITFAWASLFEVFMFTVTLAALHRISQQTMFTWRVSFLRAKRLLRNSWPLIISNLAIIVYMRIGQVMLGNMAGEEVLGVYSAATRLSELWYFIPMAISSSVFPAIVLSRENESYIVYGKRMQVFYDIMAGIAYVIIIPLALLAPLIVTILFGSDYIEAGPILRVHVWAFIFISLGVSRSRWLIAENMIRFDMLATVLGAVVNIGLNFLLIPRYGGLGAAWAVTISQAVSTYLSSVLSRRLWSVFGQLSLSLLVPLRIFSLKKSVSEIL
jgi:PST family polysaccharide transporter